MQKELRIKLEYMAESYGFNTELEMDYKVVTVKGEKYLIVKGDNGRKN